MRTMRLARTCLLLASFLGCAVPAARADAGADEPAHPALWTLADEDTAVVLFGTVHLMRPGVDWFDGEVRRAFDASDEVVLETLRLDPAEEQALVTRLGVDGSGRTLRSRLGKGERARYEAAVRSLGMPAGALDPFEPWLAAVTLATVPLMQAGYRPELGVEAVLEEEAERAGKTLVGLETSEWQLGPFDAFDESVQLGMLNATVAELDAVPADMRTMEALWLAGRAEELGAMAAEMMAGYGDDDAIAEALLGDRNRTWADWVEARMSRPGRVLVAVGAAHLAGEDALPALLEAKGYEVERVRPAAAPADD